MIASDKFEDKQSWRSSDEEVSTGYVFSNEESRKATEKAMALLLHRDRTRRELADRLYRAGFSEQAAQEAMEYVERYGYINDRRYAERYVMFQKKKRSKKELAYQLTERGIAKEIVSQVLEEGEYDGEEDAVRCLVAKRLKEREFAEVSFEERQKIAAYLGRKGYDFHVIKKVYSQLDNQDKKV